MPPRDAGTLPEATVVRLHHYRRVLGELSELETETVSSEDLARAAGVNSAQVRKDLSFLGSQGTRGVGYDVERLRESLATALGLDREWRVLLVGIGRLGEALASYRGFRDGSYTIVGLVDADPSRIGRAIAGRTVEAVDNLERIVAGRQVDLAMVAVPSEAAQEVADRLVAAGVRAILNFAPSHMEVPPGVIVRRVDLATELGVLAHAMLRSDALDSRDLAGHAATTAERSG